MAQQNRSGRLNALRLLTRPPRQVCHTASSRLLTSARASPIQDHDARLTATLSQQHCTHNVARSGQSWRNASRGPNGRGTGEAPCRPFGQVIRAGLLLSAATRLGAPGRNSIVALGRWHCCQPLRRRAATLGRKRHHRGHRVEDDHHEERRVFPVLGANGECVPADASVAGNCGRMVGMLPVPLTADVPSLLLLPDVPALPCAQARAARPGAASASIATPKNA
jgi:hypothetical protein